MEALGRHEARPIPRDLEPSTPAQVALRALVDILCGDYGAETSPEALRARVAAELGRQASDAVEAHTEPLNAVE